MNKQLLFSILLSILLTSCMPKAFYQVYETTPTTSKLTAAENVLIYEDEYCKVFYDLWQEGGNMGFRFYNKTDEHIHLNMTESFFILNGIAHDYYQNSFSYTGQSSTTTQQISSTSTLVGINYLDLLGGNQTSKEVNLGASRSNFVAYKQSPVIIVPPKTSKIIAEYNIQGNIYRDCDLFLYPKKKQIQSKQFSEAESPFVFSNRITYSVGQSTNPIRFENEFYVSAITNYPEKAITETKREEYCGETGVNQVEYFIDVSPDKFYNRYTKTFQSWKH